MSDDSKDGLLQEFKKLKENIQKLTRANDNLEASLNRVKKSDKQVKNQHRRKDD